jgi:hypothetical protein
LSVVSKQSCSSKGFEHGRAREGVSEQFSHGELDKRAGRR